MNRFVCIHGHFYQPSRENPWLEDVELQESAYPYHDWNAKVTAECYAPNTASRIIDSDSRIVEIVCNYDKISFDFGPTLLRWMERNAPDVYDAVLKADKKSMQMFSGHGSAMAQAYNHIIMPLANRRDKYTQVTWGIEDFEKRFERPSEGMWLPETAVDTETLEVLAELGIKFTILAPHQALRVRKISEDSWTEVLGGKIDPRRSYLCRLPSGNNINVLFYDGAISHQVAFKGLLNDGRSFAERLAGSFSNEGTFGELVHVVTDGETYGHHHRHGDMALAYCIRYLESNKLARITNYGDFLERFPPQHEVQIIENTSWSCVHGVERWRSNCGCNTGGASRNQEWRRPLRDSMDWLRNKLALLFESQASKYLKNPWQARDEYISVVLDRSRQNVEDFLAGHAKHEFNEGENRIVLKLLEMQRHALLMYASDAWFFDDLSGIETAQAMRHAARSMQLAESLGVNLEAEYVGMLGRASSNVPGFDNGAKIFETYVKPVPLDLLKVGVHHAISSIFDQKEHTPSRIYCYGIRNEVYEAFESGSRRLATGISWIHSEITLEEKVIAFAVLWLGDHNVRCGVQEFIGSDSYLSMKNEIKSSFEGSNIHDTLMLIEKYLGTSSYSLRDLFKDEQIRVANLLLRRSIENGESHHRPVFDNSHPLIRLLNDIGMTPPRALEAAAEVAVGSGIRKALASEEVDLDLLETSMNNAQLHSLSRDGGMIGLEVSVKIESELAKIASDPEDLDRLVKCERLVDLLGRVPFQVDLWESQNMIFSLGKKYYRTMTERANKGDETAVRWLTFFDRLSEKLGVRFKQ